MISRDETEGRNGSKGPQVILGAFLATLVLGWLPLTFAPSEPASARDWVIVGFSVLLALTGAVAGGFVGAGRWRTEMLSSAARTTGFALRVLGGFLIGVFVGALAVGL